MTIISTAVGKNPLEEMEQPLQSTKDSEMKSLDAISKTTVISIHFQSKPLNITVIQTYALASNAEEAEVEQFQENLQDFLELTPKKDVVFILGDRNAKVGSQETPGVTGNYELGVQNEAGKD